jgi:isopentenyl-diphosphate delta-isomerase
MSNEKVILVNEKDEQIGLAEKLQAHESGQLHRAVSVFVFNKKGELLIQKRASNKYHGAGLWTNTCCTHPRDGETSEACAVRRLKEEMGIDAKVKEQFSFVYKAEVENGLIENEYDHVFFGVYDGEIMLNPDEAEDCTFVSLDKVFTDAANNPEKYSIWFRIIIDKFRDHLTGMEHRLLSVGV